MSAAQTTEPRRFIVEWDEDETEWRATCPGWPSLSCFADTPDGALSGLIGIIEDVSNKDAETHG